MRWQRLVGAVGAGLVSAAGIVWLLGSTYHHPVRLAKIVARYHCEQNRLVVTGRIGPPNNVVRSAKLAVVGDTAELEVLGSWWSPADGVPVYDFLVELDGVGPPLPRLVSTRPPVRPRSEVVQVEGTCAPPVSTPLRPSAP